MWGGSLTSELRESVRLLAAERWLFAGGFVGYVAVAVWVLATGTLALSVAPALDATTLLTVAGTPIDALAVFAGLAWVAVPGVVLAALLDRFLRNHRGNLESRYRFDHPALLLVPSGVVALLAVGLTLRVGPRLPVLAVAVVASVHLFVRTLAYGHRVYSLSVPPLFSLLSVLVGCAFAVGWLAHAPSLVAIGAPLESGLSAAGVPSVLETLAAMSGLDARGLLRASVAVPTALSLAYLLAQSAVAVTVYLRAPIENPQPRPGQRYPPNSSVPTSGTAGGAPTVATDGSAESDADASPETDEESTDGDAPDDDSDDRPGTRVFTPDQPVPEAGTDTDDETSEEEWFDDTAVYTDDAASDGTPDECPACRTDIPLETRVRFCPNCGERLD